MKKLLIAAFMVFLLPLMGRAVTTSNTFTKQAVDTSWTIDLQRLGVNSLSAQATYSSATIPAKTFTDGSPSSGAITIASLTGLTTAYATNTITITSTGTDLAGAIVIMPGFQLKCGVDWAAGPTVSSAATSLAAALNQNPSINAVAVAGVITITAKTTGAWANTISVTSSDTDVTVASTYMAGGVDAAVVTIHGVPLKVGKDWFLGATPTTAAASLAAAIEAAPNLGGFVTATPSGADVGVVADANGSLYNFAMASSHANITLGGPSMGGGADMGYAIGSANITIPSHGFTVGLPVLYTEASGFPIAPLVDQTTYFIIPVDANTVKLATTAAYAVAGTPFEVISGSNSPSNIYTLDPLAITGISTFTWMVSNDGLSYSALSGADVVAFATPFTAAVKTWDLGDINYRYLKLEVLAPDTGAVNLAVVVNGFTPSDFVRKSGSTMTGNLVMDNAAIVMSGVNSALTSASTITAVQFNGSGAGLTAVPAASIADGNLGSSVVASSIALNAVLDGSVVSLSPSKILAGALPLVTTLDASGDVNVGTGVSMSTIAAAGSISTPGALNAGTVNIAGSGQLLMGNATAAQLATLVPGQAHGAQIYNSTDDTVCYSSAAVAGSWILPRGPAKDSAMVSCY